MKRLIPLLIIGLFLGCQKKTDSRDEVPESISPAVAEQLETRLDLNDVIIQTPPALVSTTSPIDIEFREAVVPGHFKGIVLDKNPFSFDPDVAGHARWISTKLLRFIPDDHLPAGQKIEGVLHGKTAFGQQKSVNDFTFSFKVAEQEVLSLEGDFVAEPGQTNRVVYEGVLTFAQSVDLPRLKRDIAMRGPRGRVNLALTQGAEATQVQITSSPIVRTQQGQNFTIMLPGRYTAQRNKWEKALFLPAVGVFRVLAHMDMTDPEAENPSYGFRFNDPIQKDADVSGYVSITPALDYKMRTQGKYLIVEGDFMPGREYTITISRGFPSVFGAQLAGDYTARFSLNNIPPEIKWLSQGVYLPTSNAYKLQFKSVNVARAHIEVTEIFPQNIGFFVQNNRLVDNSGRSTSVYDYFSYQDLHRVGEVIYKEKIEITNQQNKWIKTQLDLSPVFQNKTQSVFVVRLRFTMEDLTGRPVRDRGDLKEGDLYYEGDNYYTNPASYGYYYSRGTLNKLLISSNVGLTVKKADDRTHVFATNVLAAQPVGGLRLSMYTFQNQRVETRATDNDGYAWFTQEGAYIFGQNDDGIALITLNHPPWQINNFDVSGSSGGIEGTNVFMYADRGVHRPGDTVFLSAIVRVDNAPPPEKQPVLLEVMNPKGQVVLNTKKTCGFNGHVSFSIPTDLSDPTGNWIAKLDVGGQKFSKTLKIETVKPQRLKIAVDMPDAVYAPDLTLRGTVTAKYLFGAPAADLPATVTVDLSDQNFILDTYGDYVFSSPLKRYDWRNITVFDGNLDAQGVHRFATDIPDAGRASGLIQAVLHTTVYEKGGNFAQHRTGATIYPYTAFVGVQDVFPWGSAQLDQDVSVPIVVVDRDGTPVPGHTIRVVLYVNRYHWWYDYDEWDRRDFREMESTYRIEEATYRSTGEPIRHRFTVEDEGQHFLEITDVTSGHATGLFFYASRWGEMVREEEARNFLQITSDKNVYNTGDEATLSFDTPTQGLALLTLEQGGRILHREWKPVRESRTAFRFPINREMLPNCYASISLIQPHNQNTNDLPMRLYGIKTLYVEDRGTRLPLSLSVPSELRPKEPFTVRVTSSARQKATVTIVVVDEGLLDLTGFKTPSPWDHFFQKIRLGLQTRDNFDEILGVLYPDIDRYFTIGGGEFEEAREERLDQSRVRRFIPVVLFQEPITINPGQTVETDFTMPNYVGSVRVMVVGAAGHSYASLEQTVPVKQPLMVLPTIPRVVRPGDTFAVPVSVFAMDSTIREARVGIKASPNLRVQGPETHPVSFDKPGEKDVRFMVTVGRAIGADSITVTAVSGRHSADYTVHLPVTSPNPFYTEVIDTTVMKGQSVDLIPQKFGLEGTNEARLAFSRMPDIQLDKRVRYLIRYPYGCIEQTVSSVFPQLFLPNLVDLKPHQKQAITDHINEAMNRLSRYQMSRGFSYWPVSNDHPGRYSDWGSSYAGHFILEAKNLGYHVPPALYDHWLTEARHRARDVNKDNHRYQAYRLFLLALAGKPQIGAMNLLRENYLSELDPLSRKCLAAAYHLSGQKEVALNVDRATPTEVTSYRELSGTYGSALRDRALMTYLCLKMEDMKTASRLLQSATRSFTSGGWYSTQETSITLLAVGTYYKESPFTGGAVTFRVHQQGKGTQTMTLAGYQTTMDLEDMWDKKVTITTEGDNPLFVSLLVEGIPLESRITTGHNGIQLTRNFYNENGQPVVVDQQSQGSPFWVIYTVESLWSDPLETLALSSVFPSGWEIINTRVTGDVPPEWVSAMGITSGEYMDIRDDRVNWFFDLPAQGRLAFGVKINPTFQGMYALPPIVVEAMYSPEYYARIEGGRIRVE